MKSIAALALVLVAFCTVSTGAASGQKMTVPGTLAAAAAFSIPTEGSGKATLYIVGPGAVLRREVQLGTAANFPSEALRNIGRYTVFLEWQGGSQTGTLDVFQPGPPTDLSFLAKPSRLPVGLHQGITGTVYIFDPYRNLIVAPMPVSFALELPSESVVNRIVTSREGAAWITADSSAGQGKVKFSASLSTASSTRVIAQVPGDPCSITMTATQSLGKLNLVTQPVRDCHGNAVPDGTIVTFTAVHHGDQSTVDVPLKHGVAQGQLPAYPGETITVASGVVLGNRIVWER